METFYSLLFLVFITINCKFEGNFHKRNVKKIKNKFILNTNLTLNELEFVFSNNNFYNIQNQSSLDVCNINEGKYNKTSFVEINNTSEISYLKYDNDPDLIDIKKANNRKVLLNFDKYFKKQYEEMFEYSYTIIIFFIGLIGLIIYYTYFLPKETSEKNIENENILNDISNNDYISNN